MTFYKLNSVPDGTSPWQTFTMEMSTFFFFTNCVSNFTSYATMGLVFGAFATAFDPRGWGWFGPFAIALIVMLNILGSITCGGASMNPWRAFAPALVEVVVVCSFL